MVIMVYLALNLIIFEILGIFTLTLSLPVTTDYGLSTIFSAANNANHVEQDKTAPKEQSDLGS